MKEEYKKRFIFIAKNTIKNFKLTDEMKPVYSKLFDYFHGIPGELDLNKGNAIIGNYGVGKSTAARLFHKYLATVFPFNQNMFIISSVEDLLAELSDKNWIEGKLTYNMMENTRGGFEMKPRHVLINEFGFKYDIKNYGSDVNELIDAWLMKRYDIFQQYGKVIHITTNFGTTELKNSFHPKLVDRFREMFNFIELKGNSLRK